MTYLRHTRTRPARYKCIALNKAGNASFEFLLRVQPDLTRLAAHAKWPNSSRAADNQEASPDALSQPSREPLPPAAGSSPVASGGWLKGSTTFQVTIVIVSLLMGAVILAFILFCVIIYQIKPSPGQPPPAMVGSYSMTPTQPSKPLQATCNGLSPVSASLQYASAPNNILLKASCDPLTGHSPVHLIAKLGAHDEMIANEMQHQSPHEPTYSTDQSNVGYQTRWPSNSPFAPQPSLNSYTSMV